MYIVCVIWDVQCNNEFDTVCTRQFEVHVLYNQRRHEGVYKAAHSTQIVKFY